MSVSETNYTEQLKERFRKAGWLVHKTSERFVSGWPDLLVIKKGTSVFIEVKVKTNSLSALQRKTLIDLAKAGVLAVVMRQLEDKREIIYQVLPTGDFANLTDKLQIHNITAVKDHIKKEVEGI